MSLVKHLLKEYLQGVKYLYHFTNENTYEEKETNKTIKNIINKYGDEIDIKIIKNGGFEDNKL